MIPFDYYMVRLPARARWRVQYENGESREYPTPYMAYTNLSLLNAEGKQTHALRAEADGFPAWTLSPADEEAAALLALPIVGDEPALWKAGDTYLPVRLYDALAHPSEWNSYQWYGNSTSGEIFDAAGGRLDIEGKSHFRATSWVENSTSFDADEISLAATIAQATWAVVAEYDGHGSASMHKIEIYTRVGDTFVRVWHGEDGWYQYPVSEEIDGVWEQSEETEYVSGALPADLMAALPVLLLERLRLWLPELSSPRVGERVKNIIPIREEMLFAAAWRGDAPRLDLPAGVAGTVIEVHDEAHVDNLTVRVRFDGFGEDRVESGLWLNPKWLER